jgi:hypothetical protein
MNLINAYSRMIVDGYFRRHNSRDALKKFIFCAVRRFNLFPIAQEYGELKEQFYEAALIKDYMSLLTPLELETMFPIDKRYDGDRWGMKDYFSTRQLLNEIGMDSKIGDRVDDIIWDYQNPNIRSFGVNLMSVISALARCKGEKDPLTRWLEDNGFKLHYSYTANNPKKRIPKHWKLIRGGQST